MKNRHSCFPTAVCCVVVVVMTTRPRLYVTLEHKTSLKGQVFKIEIYASSES